MPTSQPVNQHLEALKICAPEDVGNHFSALIESFLFLSKEQRQAYSQLIYQWAEQHAAEKPVLFSYAKLTLAFNFFYAEQYEQASGLLREAGELFEKQNDPDGMAVAQTLEGSIFRTFGSVDLALKTNWSCHEQLSRSGKFPFFLIACNVNIGGIYIDRKHYEEAIPYFKTALEMAEKMEKYYWIVYSLHGLGKIYLIQQKFKEASECFENAMIAAETYNNPQSLANAMTELGNYHYATGNYSEAEDFHQQSLAIREQNQFTGGAITNCICLAEMYIRQSNPDQAIVYLEKGLKMAEDIQVKPKMYQIHLLFSTIYENKKDTTKALLHYKQFHKLREEVETEDNERKIKNAHLVFEAEQTMKENIIIKRQKEEIERKNIELQETIDELTLARVGRKAKAITLFLAILLFIFEDTILHFALHIITTDNYFISMAVKMAIVFSLNPINKAIENYLLRKVIKKEAKAVLV